jgi:hypothetical protein
MKEEVEEFAETYAVPHIRNVNYMSSFIGLLSRKGFELISLRTIEAM